MDTTDPEIVFDDQGVCSHCYRYRATINSAKYRRRIQPGALDALVAEIKSKGKGRRYDCIIGVSGGVDSTFVAYKVLEMGLKPLAVHLDNGWDSEVSVRNIEKTLDRLGIDLYTHVVDWPEFKNLQLSFFRASTSDLEIPTDHAILAILYEVAVKEGVRYILSGHNTATESGGVATWAQGHGDWRYIKQIHRAFRNTPLTTYPHYGIGRFAYYTLIKRIQWVQILDFFDYQKEAALKVLQDRLDWHNYGGKHYESIFTRFYLGYFLPTKFGYEVKRSHISSMIWSGQLSRDAALREMERIDYPLNLQHEDREYVIKKLGVSHEQFDELMNLPRKDFYDYPSYKRIFRRIPPLMFIYHRLKRR